MSEDKMREEHWRQWGIAGMPKDKIRLAEETWKAATEACAAIKDAEIAESRATALKMQAEIDRQMKIQTDWGALVAARDLMIEEWAELFEKVKTALFYGECSINERNPKVGSKNEGIARMMESAQNEIEQALTKSEHHNPRALEKMLLEARIDELNDMSARMVHGGVLHVREYVNGYNAKARSINNKIAELKAKLAELNKE